MRGKSIDPNYHKKYYQRKKTEPGWLKKKNKMKSESFHKNLKSQLRKRYSSLKSRCENTKDKDYHQYGGRGIKCEWDSFELFYDDMINSYKKAKKTIKGTIALDRKNPNGNYSKENTHFVSFSDNCKYNTRTNRYITYKGKTMIIADWAREIGTSRQTIRNRLEKGWTPEQIVETKVSHANRLENGEIKKYGI